MSIRNLDPKLRQFLDEETNAPVPDLAERQARVWQGIEARLGFEPQSSEEVGDVAASATRNLVPAVVSAALGGVALGFGLGVWLSTRPLPDPVGPDVPIEVLGPPPLPAPPPVRPSPEPVAPAPAGRTRERALIERARVSLNRNDPQEALVTLMGHAREFPAGKLVEERERLMIQAFDAAGRSDEARERAASFVRRFPNSVHLPFVRRVLSAD
ncbi:MAG: hypothetical protein AAGA48_34525 [Myxococcota bacterium]